MYYALSFLFFFSGLALAFKPVFFVYFFLFLLVAVPSSNAYADIYYMHGLFVYDFFFLGLLVAVFLLAISGRMMSLGGLRSVALFSAFFGGIYFLGYFFFGGSVDKYFLRDLKLVWILLVAVIFCTVIENFKIKFSERFVSIWVIASAGFSFLAAFSVLFGIYKIDDAFYESNSFRYLSVSTYIAAFYVVYIWYKNGVDGAVVDLLGWFGFIVSVGVLLLSGARIILIATFVSLAFSIKMTPLKSLIYIFFVAVNFSIFYFVSEALEVSRVTESMSADGVGEQILNRLMPALQVIESMSLHEFVFGKGFGFTFEIPWFDYRDLDSRNNFVDSFWVTSICKFGLFTFFYAYFFIRLIVFFCPRRLSRAVTVLVVILMLTFAVPYQGIAIGLVVAGAVIGGAVKSSKVRLKS